MTFPSTVDSWSINRSSSWTQSPLEDRMRPLGAKISEIFTLFDNSQVLFERCYQHFSTTENKLLVNKHQPRRTWLAVPNSTAVVAGLRLMMLKKPSVVLC